VQAIATTEIVRHVSPSSFRPPPKVESSVIRITPRTEPLVSLEDLERFRIFVQALFGMRRKQLANSLRSVSGLSADEATALLESEGIDPRARPENVSPSQFGQLARRIGSTLRHD
jgi:16S rRNA (adenine1518-N6/adenine1519-N6)-dimethyltransferase